MTGELTSRGYRVIPSQSNFILVTPPAGPAKPDAATIQRMLKVKAIFVRYFDQDRLDDKLRISIGTPPQNGALLAALDEIAEADTRGQ